MPKITAQQYREFRAWKPKLLTQAFSDGESVAQPVVPAQSATLDRTLPETHEIRSNLAFECESIANYSNSYEIVGMDFHPGLNANYDFEIQRLHPNTVSELFTPLSLEKIFAQTQAQTSAAESILDQKLKIGGLALKPIVNSLLVQEYQRLGTVLKVTQQHLQALQQQALQTQVTFKAQLDEKDSLIKHSQLEHMTLAKHQEHLRDQLIQLKNLQKELESSALRYQRLQHEYQILTDRHLRQTEDFRKVTQQAQGQQADTQVLKKQLKMVFQQVHEHQQALQAAEKNMTLLENKYQLEHKLRLSQEVEIKDLFTRLKQSQAIADMEKTLRQKSDQRADFSMKTRQMTEEQLFKLFSNQETPKLN